MTRTQRLVGALIGGVALVVLTGCLPAATAWQGSGSRVAVVGDSQVYDADHDAFGDSQQHLTDAIVAAGHQDSHADFIGATTADLAEFTSATTGAGWPDPGPQIAVTVLGTNDMHRQANGQPAIPLATAEANYTAYLNAVDAAGSTCDVMVEIVQTPQWGLDQNGPAWNAFLASRVAGHNGVIVPWASTVAAHPEYVNTTDGVHQTAAGRVAFRAAILAGVEQCGF